MSEKRSWQVENFKGVEKAELPLSGLSLLSGANSAGKSSLTQTLLLLSQSQGNDVVLNGPLVRFGSASDVINEHSEAIEFSWDLPGFHGIAPTKHVDNNVTAKITLTGPRRTTTTDQTSLVVASVSITRDGVEIFEASNERVKSKTLAARNPGQIWGDSLLRVRSIEGAAAPNRTYVAFSGLFPSYVLYKATSAQIARTIRDQYERYSASSEEYSRWLAQDLLLSYAALLKPPGASEVQHFAGTGAWRRRILRLVEEEPPDPGLLDEIIEELATAVASDDYVAMNLGLTSSFRSSMSFIDRGMDSVIPESHKAAWSEVLAAFRDLREVATRVRYIGPLREEPQVLSTTGGRNDSIPAGLRGEYTADLLFRSRNAKVNYHSPAGREKTAPLQEAVGEWAAWLGVGESVRVSDQGKLGRGILVVVDGRERDLTTIGVGVSQLLPVITVLLAAPPGSILVLEQPELHLHPAIQSRLANFFASARKDISLVIETHSEYLITRLRRLNVSSEGSIDDLSFLFATPGERGAVIRPLEIGSLGDINEWPQGFFDTQGEEERRLLVALGKRAKGQA
ncbi:DUF3696 domain-containing protein [Brachybacterium sp. GCM10030267]|uniref:AAA family ATPase n=1 Tax=Brachybacterium sp. GCM10030267 TaxID=3273381 RepID=UPI00360F8723